MCPIFYVPRSAYWIRTYVIKTDRNEIYNTYFYVPVSYHSVIHGYQWIKKETAIVLKYLIDITTAAGNIRCM